MGWKRRSKQRQRGMKKEVGIERLVVGNGMASRTKRDETKGKASTYAFGESNLVSLPRRIPEKVVEIGDQMCREGQKEQATA